MVLSVLGKNLSFMVILIATLSNYLTFLTILEHLKYKVNIGYQDYTY